MSDKVTQILSLRASGHTKRWHTLPHFGGQTVAEHSGQALTLLLTLHPDPSIRLVKAVLWHDSAERVVGDVPAPVRRANREFASIYERVESEVMSSLHPVAHEAISALDESERAWLRAVDVLELLHWCGDQVMMGNQHCVQISERAMRYLRTDTSVPAEVLQYLDMYDEEGPRSFA